MFLSPSQIETYDPSTTGCPRKWAFIYLEGLRPPATLAQAKGSAFHKILEDYLKYGKAPNTWDDLGAAAATALPYLPPPGSVEVESRFAFRSHATWYNGYRDFRVPGILIGDHKTTGNFKWMKTPEQLVKNTQAIIYAVEEFRQYDVPHILGRWNYTRLSGTPKTIPVDFKLERNQTGDIFFGHIEPLAHEIEQLLYDSPDPNEVRPNINACDAFGGCPFSKICKLTTEERFFSDMGTLADRIKAQQEKQAAAGGGLTPGAPPQGLAQIGTPVAQPGRSTAAPQPGGLDELLANLTVPAPPPASVLDPLAAILGPKPAALPIIPPPRTTPAAGVPAVAPSAPTVPPAPSAPTILEIPLTVTPPQPASALTLPSAPEPKAAEPAAFAELAEPSPSAGRGVQTILTLYVDCAPVGEECTAAFDIVSEAMSVIRNEKGTHYRLLPYGTGPAVLQEVVAQILSTRKSGGIFLSTTNQAENDALTAFQTAATSVVRSLR